MRKLNVVGGGNEQQRHRLTDENWVAGELRNPLIQSRSRAKSQEGGAWAGFVLT